MHTSIKDKCRACVSHGGNQYVQIYLTVVTCPIKLNVWQLCISTMRQEKEIRGLGAHFITLWNRAPKPFPTIECKQQELK